MASVSLTAQQVQWLQSLVSAKVQAEAATHPAYSGEISNADTFLANDLSVAEAILAAIQAAA